MEAPGHAAVEFPIFAVRPVEGPFKFEPKSIVTEIGCKSGPNIVPGIVIRFVIAQAFRAIQRSQVKGPVAGKFMEDISFEVPGFVGIEVFAQAEAQAADEAVDAVEVLFDAVIGPVVGPIEMRILELALRFDIPRVTQGFLAAPFDAGLLVPRPERTLRFVAVYEPRRSFTVQPANAGDDVEIVTGLAEPGPVKATRVAFVFPISRIKRGPVIEVVEGQALTKGAVVIARFDRIPAEFKAVAMTVITVAAEVTIG